MKYITFDQIPVWQDSHKLVVDLYRVTRLFPTEEKFSLISQIRRASSSIAANIVEGFNRHTTRELINYLYMARGSAGETHYHLILSRDLGYLETEDFQSLAQRADSIVKQLSNWINTLETKKENRQ